ncbi:hypothetical protein [Paenibacillus illinoisensis]|uniref:Uncharacterized protein n=1 Tax=Paenibacillus illinoisensis TaxID=59845 RepID=A0A2W0CFS1_9BACL|nr:hypothetical protein [Paenibacillus illinoisensis]PYY29649.1 hypothetical protein PIL02S_01849 [Paenibacillus illinoisensis]
MKRKTIYILGILIVICGLAYVVQEKFQDKQNDNPHTLYLLNGVIWQTQLRISDTLTYAVENNKLETEFVRSLLTLNGYESDALYVALERKYQHLLNGPNTSDYIYVKIKENNPTAQQIDLLKKLSILYKDLSLQQSQLINEDGIFNEKIWEKILSIDKEINTLVSLIK